jgi:replicative DNA helicase
VSDRPQEHVRKVRLAPTQIDPAPAEKALIGYVLMYPTRFSQCVVIRDTHFSDPWRGEVWSIMVGELDTRGSGITPLLIAEGMVRRGLKPTVPEATDFLVECQDEARNAPDAETAGSTFRDMLLDYAYRRKSKLIANEIRAMADEAVSLEEVKSEVQTRVFELMNFETAGTVRSLEEAIQDEFRRMEQQESGVAPGLMSGIEELDKIWNGACPGDLIIVAARPSVGKTALGTQIGTNLVLPEPTLQDPTPIPSPGGIWSLEMPKQSIIRRMACQLAKIDMHRVSRNEFFKGEKDAYTHALTRLLGAVKDGLLTISDAKTIDGRIRPKSITDIIAEVRHWRNRMPLKWIMVDYIQLITGIRKKGESRELEVGRTSQMLKQLGQELEIPVFALAQLRRPDKDRLRKRPTMNDLRESGQLEQDADGIIIIHNWDYISDDKPAERPVCENAELILAKYRNGRTGRAEVDYRPPSTTFGPRTQKGVDDAAAAGVAGGDEVPRGW